MAFEVFDLAFEEGQINMGGTAGTILYVPASHVATLVLDDTKQGVVVTSLTLKTGKKWSSIYTTRDTASVVDKEVGEMDGGSFETELEFWTPKIREEVLRLKALFSNGGFIFAVKDGNNVQRIVGSPDHPAFRVAADISAGKAPKDRNGASFKFSAANARPAPIYTAAIALTVAV